MKTKTYNGHKNWNYWNVSLWIRNDEGLYNFARELVRKLGKERAARMFVDECGTDKTPDGAAWTISAVRAALSGLE